MTPFFMEWHKMTGRLDKSVRSFVTKALNIRFAFLR